MNEPKLTIGIPVYNGIDSLGKCLDSILAQTFTDFKLIIIDNCSTDGTLDLIKEYAEKDSRIQWSRNRANLGQMISSFRLMFRTKTEFYALVHADLQWKPTFAEKCIKALEKDSGAVIAYTQCQFVDDNFNDVDIYRDNFNFAETDPGKRFLNVVTGMGWCTAWHGIIRTDLLQREYLSGFIMDSGNAAPDNFILAILATQGKFIQLEEPLFIRRKNSYQAKPESIEERYYRLFGYGHYFPFCNFIRDHIKLAQTRYCGYSIMALKDLKTSYKEQFEDEPLWNDITAKANPVINTVIGSLLATYRRYVEFEIDHAVDIIKTGNIYRYWIDEQFDCKPLACRQVGKHRAIDFAVLTQLNEGLDFAYSLIPARPGLHYARALVKMWLGRPDEALVAVNRELKNDPVNLKALELQKHLEKVLAN